MTKAEAIEYVLNNIENIQDQYDYDYIGVRTQENAFTKGKFWKTPMFGLMAKVLAKNLMEPVH